ncbi:DUF1127 domain-containing protein [Mesorhizobium sp. CAU 1732]|uniref:DUF1127 domain-containing protein n=1 Tax=Mesorhizobium sp. CAU 1732 TaxID=3140358 RepID=UPI003260C0F7
MPTNLPAIAGKAVPRSRRRRMTMACLLRLWRRGVMRYRQRRTLAELDEHLLRDIGVTRREAEAECRKPPWR